VGGLSLCFPCTLLPLLVCQMSPVLSDLLYAGVKNTRTFILAISIAQSCEGSVVTAAGSVSENWAYERV
jgi:hypothetical protein